MLSLLALIPAFPLLGFAILFVTAGLLPKRWITTIGVGSVGISTILALIVMFAFLDSPAALHRNRLDLDRRLRLHAAYRLLSRRAVGPDDVGRHLRQLSHPPLLRRVHERGRGIQPLLRLHEPVRRLDAGAGPGGQPAVPLSRLGGRRPLQLSPDRLLVSRSRQRARRAQGVRRHPGRRHRDGDRPLRSVHQFGHARDPAADAASRRALAGGIGAADRRGGAAARRRASASRRSCRCRPGCPTPWPARHRSARSSMPRPW